MIYAFWMKVSKIKESAKGWFVGDFDNAMFRTKDFEVAHKKYKKGETEDKHMHKIATEFTLISLGKVLMNGQEFSAGDIIQLEPGEATDFKALTDASTVVVKVPSVQGDKYLV
jgi:quercetin dioxygenase-like cupin family protein